MPKVLTERATSEARIIAEANAGPSPSYRVRIIEGPRWGSSGYYTSQALDSAPAAFEGAKVYLDHPTRTDETERPERSLRDRVGSVTDVTREADGAWGKFTVLPHMAQLVASLASGGDLDMSIRATAEAMPGEVNGRSGLIVSRFVEGMSVDLVTEAGAGGRVFELIESARAAAPAELVAREADSIVIVDESTQEANPVTSAGPVGESAPAHTTKEKHMEITEAKYAELTAAADRVTALEGERDSAIQRAEAAEADARKVAREAYQTQVVAALAASNLPTPARDRVADALNLDESAEVPAAPATVIEAAIAKERDYVASLAPVLGKVESPRRLGFGAAPEPVTESYTNPWGRTINPVKEA